MIITINLILTLSIIIIILIHVVIAVSDVEQHPKPFLSCNHVCVALQSNQVHHMLLPHSSRRVYGIDYLSPRFLRFS